MDELVEVAFVGDEPQALMIQGMLEENGVPSLMQRVTPSGPQIGSGLLNPGGGAQRVMVHAHRAEEARALLAQARAESEGEAPEPANAGYGYQADAQGRRPRNYTLIGAYARAFLWCFGTLAVACGIFMLVRGL